MQAIGHQELPWRIKQTHSAGGTGMTMGEWWMTNFGGPPQFWTHADALLPRAADGAQPFRPPTYTDPTCREAQMVVIERDASGKPTVWCDPEIADLIRALNAGGVRTEASCSGHGEKPGWIALKDGRQLAIVPDLDSFKRMIAPDEPPASIREFLHALQDRNEKDNGLFPQVASEVEADAKALRRVLAVLDFYHPPRTAGVGVGGGGQSEGGK
jgi:hypothetical protein